MGHMFQGSVFLVIFCCSAKSLEINNLMQNLIQDVSEAKSHQNECPLKPENIQWCIVPPGQKITHLNNDEDDATQLLTEHTKCAWKAEPEHPVVCKGCYRGRWYKTTCDQGQTNFMKYTKIISRNSSCNKEVVCTNQLSRQADCDIGVIPMSSYATATADCTVLVRPQWDRHFIMPINNANDVAVFFSHDQILREMHENCFLLVVYNN